MKVKKGLKISTSDFWYDLTKGGYLTPEDVLQDQDDVNRVKQAIATVVRFERACEEHIKDFIQ